MEEEHQESAFTRNPHQIKYFKTEVHVTEPGVRRQGQHKLLREITPTTPISPREISALCAVTDIAL